LRIAHLAAEGLTNRAIAERAFVSVKTVETNLKRAYGKLDITSRAQLARALDRSAMVPADEEETVPSQPFHRIPR
jgi:DNA-binding NarL/FixJ family response regulator